MPVGGVRGGSLRGRNLFDVLRNHLGSPLGWFLPPDCRSNGLSVRAGEIVPPGDEIAGETDLGVEEYS